MNVKASELGVWQGSKGPKAVRKLLELLHKNASKAASAEDKRTRAKATKAVAKMLGGLEEANRPMSLSEDPVQLGVQLDRWTKWEAAVHLRKACHDLKLGFGLPSEPLPREASRLMEVCQCALGSLPSALKGRPATKVNPYTLHAAGSLDRARLKSVLDDQSGAPTISGEDQATERAVTRLQDAGILIQTELGQVAVIVHKQKSKKD